MLLNFNINIDTHMTYVIKCVNHMFMSQGTVVVKVYWTSNYNYYFQNNLILIIF